MPLSVEHSTHPRTWLRLDWETVYAYVVLCAGCYASYLGAQPVAILATGVLLALPNVAKARAKTSPIEIAAQVAVALIFAVLAHSVGRGIAEVIGT